MIGWNKYVDVGSFVFSFTFVVCVHEIRVIYLFPPFSGFLDSGSGCQVLASSFTYRAVPKALEKLTVLFSSSR